MKTISIAKFDLTGPVAVIAAGGAGVITYIVGVSFTNNETDPDNDIGGFFFAFSATPQYGSTSKGFHLRGNMSWTLPMSRDSIKHPYFISAANQALVINTVAGRRLSGAVWYYQE